MLLEQQIKHYRALDTWFESPLGKLVAQEFAAQLTALKDILSGETLLQLATCGENSWLDTLRFKHTWCASPFAHQNKVALLSSMHQLPVQRNSIDCVVAPLSLEPYGFGNQLIDEIDRILKPMGFVVIMSLNPLSAWGLAQKCGLLSCYPDRKIAMHSAFTLNRAFLQRGYRQCFLKHFCYIPPVNRLGLIKKLAFLDEVGKMVWPFPSGFYCYIAQKYELIGPYLQVKQSEQAAIKGYKSPLQPAI